MSEFPFANQERPRPTHPGPQGKSAACAQRLDRTTDHCRCHCVFLCGVACASDHDARCLWIFRRSRSKRTFFEAHEQYAADLFGRFWDTVSRVSWLVCMGHAYALRLSPCCGGNTHKGGEHQRTKNKGRLFMAASAKFLRWESVGRFA